MSVADLVASEGSAGAGESSAGVGELGAGAGELGADAGESSAGAGELGARAGEPVAAERYMAFSPYTRVANMTGCPAMSVPLHWTAEGIPVGAHLLGRMWEEATLLGLAHQLEQAAPWHDRRPAVRV